MEIITNDSDHPNSPSILYISILRTLSPYIYMYMHTYTHIEMYIYSGTYISVFLNLDIGELPYLLDTCFCIHRVIVYNHKVYIHNMHGYLRFVDTDANVLLGR